MTASLLVKRVLRRRLPCLRCRAFSNQVHLAFGTAPRSILPYLWVHRAGKDRFSSGAHALSPDLSVFMIRSFKADKNVMSGSVICRYPRSRFHPVFKALPGMKSLLFSLPESNMKLKSIALSAIASVVMAAPALSQAATPAPFGHDDSSQVGSIKLAQQSQRTTTGSQMHNNMLHGDEQKTQAERGASGPTQNSPRAPADPQVHDKMLHGDEQRPRLASAGEPTYHQSKTRQQVINEMLNQTPYERARMKELFRN